MSLEEITEKAHDYVKAIAGSVPSHIAFDEATCQMIVSKAWALARAFEAHTPPPPAAAPAVVDPAAPVVDAPVSETPAPEATI